MEYIQMTLDDWVQMKQKLKQELLGVKQSFVRIGYALRKIEDGKLYEQDGYKSIAEFAKAEYGLEPSTTSRFININREFSVDGYSEHLRPEFEDLGRSQLEEMLKLPNPDREMIRPEASREDIRELKRFNKAEPEEGEADDIRELVEKFFEVNQETLNELFSSEAYTTGEVEKLVDIVNPSGNKTFKKGLYFLMMYENEIKIKKFGQNPQSMPWAEFFALTQNIFEGAAAGHKTWQNYFGGGEDAEDSEDTSGEYDTGDVQEADTKRTEDDGTGEKNPLEASTGNRSDDTKTVQPDGGGPEGDGNENPIESGAEENQQEEIAPAQETAENLEGKTEEEDEKEESSSREEPAERTEEPEAETAAGVEEEGTEPGFKAMNEPEVIEKPFGSRKDYIDTLTAYGLACYMAKEYRSLRLTEHMLRNLSELEKWLLTEVDQNGNEEE